MRSQFFLVVMVLMIATVSAGAQTTETAPPATAAPKSAQTQTPAELATALLDATNAWVASLTGEQKTKCMIEYTDIQRTDWHFIPRPWRKGLALTDMTPKQRELAHRLMSAAVSPIGYDKLLWVIKQQDYLKIISDENPPVCCGKWGSQCATTGGCPPLYSSGYYFISVFGIPSPTALWGLSIEGHHFSVNYSMQNGRVVSSTPNAIGSTPEIMYADNYPPIPKGTRVLPQEENIALELLASLDETQRKIAIVNPTAPRDIWNAGGLYPYARYEGLPAAWMTPAQQAILRRLLDVYVHLLPPVIAEERLRDIEANGFDKIRFAFLGSPQQGQNKQYKIQGPAFLIEFSNSQPDPAGNPANHIHTVWRDLRNDFNQRNPFYEEIQQKK